MTFHDLNTPCLCSLKCFGLIFYVRKSIANCSQNSLQARLGAPPTSDPCRDRSTKANRVSVGGMWGRPTTQQQNSAKTNGGFEKLVGNRRPCTSQSGSWRAMHFSQAPRFSHWSGCRRPQLWRAQEGTALTPGLPTYVSLSILSNLQKSL